MSSERPVYPSSSFRRPCMGRESFSSYAEAHSRVRTLSFMSTYLSPDRLPMLRSLASAFDTAFIASSQDSIRSHHTIHLHN